MCFLVSYAIGGIFMGQLADKYSKRKLIFCLYFLIAGLVAILGAMSYVQNQKNLIFLYYIVKVCNGLLQSPGWAINLVIISAWFPRTGRGLLIGCWASNANMGDLLGTQVYKAVTGDQKVPENWGMAFFIVAAIVLLMGIINFFFLVETPAEVGLRVD